MRFVHYASLGFSCVFSEFFCQFVTNYFTNLAHFMSGTEIGRLIASDVKLVFFVSFRCALLVQWTLTGVLEP